MNRRKPHTIVLAALFLLVLTVAPNRARGAGYLVYDMSAEALGKASAVAALAHEPAAVWFNPGAMSFMPGWRASAGLVTIFATNDFEPANGGPKVSADTGTFFLPQVFGTFEITRWMHAGIGVCTPWGLAMKWPEDWVGREHSIESDMQTIVVNPAMSFMVWKNRLSIGVGFQLVRATALLRNGLPEVAGGDVRFGGGTWGYGGNAGVFWQILPGKLNAALTYRSRVKLAFDGKADFNPAAEEFEYELRDQGGKADITLPDIITVGAAYKPHKAVEISLDFNIILWSVFKSLALDFELEGAPDTVMRRNWNDGVTVRAGVDYETPVKGLHVRGGLIFDQNPSPKNTLAPSLPDAYRFDVGVGVGYEWKWLKADLGYLFVYFLPSEATTGVEGPEGTYNAIAHLLALTVAVQFGIDRHKKVAAPPPTETEPVRPAPETRPEGKKPEEKKVTPPPRVEPRPAPRPPEGVKPGDQPGSGAAPDKAKTPAGGPKPATTPAGGAPAPRPEARPGETPRPEGSK